LVGHANLRRGILKDEIRSLTSNELKFIYKKLEKCLKKGALGLSTGLVYTHAKLATTEELVELAKEIAKNNQSELFIHRKNGTIRERNSYGNDPYPPEG